MPGSDVAVKLRKPEGGCVRGDILSAQCPCRLGQNVRKAGSFLVVGLLRLASCVALPMGPSVAVMPTPGKPFAVFVPQLLRGLMPTEDNMQQLVAYAEHIENAFGLHWRYNFGGNSSALPLIAAGKMSRRINHVRIGEGTLPGRETLHRTAWPESYQDAFLRHAEVIELKEKPSVPMGATSEDASRRHLTFVDQGDRTRAILNIRREDVDMHGLTPLDPRLTMVGASSDHLIGDATAAASTMQVGDNVVFALNYSALLAVMTSRYVAKRVRSQEEARPWTTGPVIRRRH